MPFSFLLPDIGEGLEEAEIVEWLVTIGQEVERDHPLVEVLTDKASSELPSPVAGTILSFGATEGERIRVGDLLVEIADNTDQASDTEHPTASLPSQRLTDAPIPPPEPAPSHRPKASPATRRLALSLDVDLTAISGSGPGGRITSDDVRHADSHSSLNPTSLTTRTGRNQQGESAATGLGQATPGRHELRGVRGVVARNMAQAWSEIPHIHSMDEIDASLLVDFRTRIRSIDRPGSGAVTVLTIAAMAVVRALLQFPVVNGHVEGSPGETMVIPDEINLGIATATERGLVVPVVHNADQLDLFTLAERVAAITTQARAGDASPSNLAGATFTITNYGSLGGRFATPIIPPGQGAILGLGAVAERPVALKGAVVARPTLPIVLGADHRIIDGDLAEAFRSAVVADLVEPLQLLVSS